MDIFSAIPSKFLPLFFLVISGTNPRIKSSCPFFFFAPFDSIFFEALLVLEEDLGSRVKSGLSLPLVRLSSFRFKSQGYLLVRSRPTPFRVRIYFSPEERGVVFVFVRVPWGHRSYLDPHQWLERRNPKTIYLRKILQSYLEKSLISPLSHTIVRSFLAWVPRKIFSLSVGIAFPVTRIFCLASAFLMRWTSSL